MFNVYVDVYSAEIKHYIMFLKAFYSVTMTLIHPLKLSNQCFIYFVYFYSIIKINEQVLTGRRLQC